MSQSAVTSAGSVTGRVISPPRPARKPVLEASRTCVAGKALDGLVDVTVLREVFLCDLDRPLPPAPAVDAALRDLVADLLGLAAEKLEPCGIGRHQLGGVLSRHDRVHTGLRIVADRHLVIINAHGRTLAARPPFGLGGPVIRGWSPVQLSVWAVEDALPRGGGTRLGRLDQHDGARTW